MRSQISAQAFLLRCRQPPSSLRNQHLRKLIQYRFRPFHSTSSLYAIKTQRLTDIGEGNKEVQIIQWYVTEGARVEEWDNLCQVQSDKAADDITARYGGVVRKLHWEPDDTVQTGEPLVDIDVAEANGVKDEQALSPSGEATEGDGQQVQNEGLLPDAPKGLSEEQVGEPRGKHSALATPAVRGLLKEHAINITSIRGTGRDGRVLKEDIHQYLRTREPSQSPPPPPSSPYPPPSTPTLPQAEETTVTLSPIQAAMYRSMTASLSIPHFLFTSEVDITDLTALRQRLNSSSTSSSISNSTSAPKHSTPPKGTLLPFILPAHSLVLTHYPLLNARLQLPSSASQQPSLILRPTHNIGIAMDTPSGLLVPVIHNINSTSPNNGHTILSLADEISRLSALGSSNRLPSASLSAGTVTVSNIGALGGTVVSPRLVSGQTLIVGVGRSRAVPSFVYDEAERKGTETVKKREIVTLSWAADHRVVDGACVARAAALVKTYLEDVGRLVVELR